MPIIHGQVIEKENKNCKFIYNSLRVARFYYYSYPERSTCIQISWSVTIDDVEIERKDSSGQKEDETHQGINQVL